MDWEKKIKEELDLYDPFDIEGLTKSLVTLFQQELKNEREQILEEVESKFGVTADHYGLLGDGTSNDQGFFLFISEKDWKEFSLEKLKR